ncbi:hypothetical protein IFM89_004875 [Coptis chinensis]|uniref:Lipase-like C-terminal domain-containing protein n=1 Tax=Coptis chinensis TaxID=261450 RepID=A0A835LM95_9MAGN|nr:hypothetical protein IFM89_004875 [Coptis chinensis]
MSRLLLFWFMKFLDLVKGDWEACRISLERRRKMKGWIVYVVMEFVKDRELFYYLKGGQVDYGEEHSKIFGRSQFGRIYEEG